jgi:alanine transaminase
MQGFMGECGLRGGYFEMLGFTKEVKQQILKLSSINLCPNAIGQITVGLMVQPPKEGDESYTTYVQERDAILSSMQRRAVSLTSALNSIPGVQCNSIDGAMYAFPAIVLPPKLVEHAQSLGEEPDAFYCMELLKATGIVVVPGSGFGQRDGTFHFRTTILPPEDKMVEVVRQFTNFHTTFIKKFE